MIHLYDACVFKREVLAVVAEGVNARGRGVPVAWSKRDEALSDSLLERGCNMQHRPVSDTDGSAEMMTRDLWERMRTGRFKVDKRLQEWIGEFKTFTREGDKIPRDTHPLMAATRFALQDLDYATATSRAHRKPLKMQVATV